MIPGTLQGGGAAFAPTHWSVVLRSAESQAPEGARAALEQLCRVYWPPLYTFVRRRGHGPADAQDLVQGFFVHLLESRAYARVDPSKGTFRSFLLASLKYFLADARDREQTLKRGGGRQFVSLEEGLAEAEEVAAALVEGLAATASNRGGDADTPPSDEDRRFEQRWAFTLLDVAVKQVRADYATDGKTPLFEALKPFVAGGPTAPPDHALVAAQLGIPTVTLRSHIHRLRQRFRAALRAEVAHTVADPALVDEELRHLRDVLIAAATPMP